MFSILRKLIKKQKPDKKDEHVKNENSHHADKGKKTEVIITARKKTPSVKNKASRLKKKKKQVNRHGIAILKNDEDFSKFFKDDEEQKPEKRKKTKAQEPINMKKRKKSYAVNKHGFRIFNDNTDLYELFGHESAHESVISPLKACKPENRKNIHAEDDFGNLLEKTLKDKSTKELLNEKQGGIIEKKHISKNEILKYYPLPQEELDLHGYTGAQAAKKTENFLQKARYKGKRTVIIIVGKGTHSPSKAVLPDVVEAKLVELKRKNQVFAFKWEKGSKKKSGAIIVYLKNPTI